MLPAAIPICTFGFRISPAFPKDEVIIPADSRNVYDAAIRAVGVKIIEVDTPEALRLAIGPKTAMIYLFAGPRLESGPMSTEAICAIAKQHNVPVMVDAAAEILTIPNVHLQRGATLVGYSGGKFIRGPQSAGLLLGRKDLVKAAWVHSAPHHGYARAMKVGREEMIGMLVAVESWVKRDHKAEWAKWVARCDYIAESVRRFRASPPQVAARARRQPEQPQPARVAAMGFEAVWPDRRRGRQTCSRKASRESRWAAAVVAAAVAAAARKRVATPVSRSHRR